jgi:hypothetical protein
MTGGWTLDDLVLFRDAGVKIDPVDLLEVYRRENIHLDFMFCVACGAGTFQQHLPGCPRESILGDPNWYEVLSR